MSEITITLRLPDKLATEAEARGLLEAESIETLLREELRRRRITKLFKRGRQVGKFDCYATY